MKMDNFLILTSLISEISFLHSYGTYIQKSKNSAVPVTWKIMTVISSEISA